MRINYNKKNNPVIGILLGIITMILEVTGEVNEVDYTGRTRTETFDFTNYEISGLANFGFTVKNIPKPLNFTIKSIEWTERTYTAMKKYTKPQIETKNFEVIDIISVSTSLFSGIADIDESKSIEWNDKMLDPKDAF